MEYIVSARKYRPSSFDAVVGQQALTVTLKNAVATNKLAHAYLFCGPRGVGKTTCARIFAKVINCTSPLPDGDACGECESCKAFAEQRSLNIFELDAASNNGVEHIKQLMDQTRVPPQVGTYKVFIIDEVHMLTTAAFNAFLKTLEEPPAHVVFILATTEKHKILPTILSRCQVFDFQRMSVADIVGHLKKVAEDQQVTCEEEALTLIAEKADGGMRDALSIFDQVVSFCQGNVTYEKVIEDLNVLDVDNYFRAVDLALECKVMEEMVLLNSVLERGFDAGHFINGLASHIRNVLMARDVQTLKLIESSETQRQKYAEQAKRCNPTFLYKALRILNDCDVNYRQSSNKRMLAELTIIEMAQILQKDDDAGVGRGPHKKLKSLFKKIMNDIQQVGAQQVAQAGSQSSTLRHSGENRSGGVSDSVGKTEKEVSSQDNKSGLEGKKPETSPKVKVSSLGMSFGRLLGKENETRDEKKPSEESVVENSYFTQNDLRVKWVAMCNRMALTQNVSLSHRLRNVIPVITEYPAIEVVVENDLLRDELMTVRRRLEVTMAKELHNGNVKLDIRLAEAGERQAMLTPKQTIDKLLEESEAFNKLFTGLQLELE